MAELWDEQLMWAKYHLSVSQRLFENFSNYETKNFLSGCLNEMALSATGLVNAYLVYFNVRDGVKITGGADERIRVFEKFGGGDVVRDVLAVFEIRRAQKNSPIELLKGDKILLLDKGEYKALTVTRLGELIDGLEKGIRGFGKS